MEKKYILLPVILLAGCAGFLQFGPSKPEKDLVEYQEFITKDFLFKHLSVIAADSLQGREAGMPGQKKAAQYLSDFYSTLGMKPMGNEDFHQTFLLNAEITDSLVYQAYRIDGMDTLKVHHSTASPSSSAEFLRLFGGSVPLNGRVVFAGFGVNDEEREVTHLTGTEMAGKWVLVFNEIPHVVEGDTLINPGITNSSRISTILNRLNAEGILVITDEASESFNRKAEIASTLIDKPLNMRLKYLDDSTSASGYPKGFMQISPTMAVEMLGLESREDLNQLREKTTRNIREFEPFDLDYLLEYDPYMGTREIESENVVAMIEGSDPEVREEVVVLMAHYDHIGITQPDESGDRINNGADDNGSGTVALMSVANALAKAAEEGVRPKRSVLFLHVSAEEKGLLGSRYYSDHPAIPIEQTVTNFNADMIGRSDSRNLEKGDSDYVYIIGGDIISAELDSLVHVANDESVNLRLDYHYNDLQDPNQFYRRSDHWNFGRLGVPFVFFFTGVHEDYHQPSDHVEKVDLPKLTKTAGLLFSSTVKVANYEGRPVVDNQEFIEITKNLPR
ncbi:MAG: M28 family peptidase [Balneolaceae bacterium]